MHLQWESLLGNLLLDLPLMTGIRKIIFLPLFWIISPSNFLGVIQLKYNLRVLGIDASCMLSACPTTQFHLPNAKVKFNFLKIYSLKISNNILWSYSPPTPPRSPPPPYPLNFMFFLKTTPKTQSPDCIGHPLLSMGPALVYGWSTHCQSIGENPVFPSQQLSGPLPHLHAGTMLGLSLCGSCASCHSLWVHVCVYLCLGNIVSLGYPPPLTLKTFLPSLQHRAQSLEGRRVIQTFHLWLSAPKAPILCTLSSCEFLLITIYCKKQLLLWRLSIICGHSNISLGVILLLQSFSRKIGLPSGPMT